MYRGQTLNQDQSILNIVKSINEIKASFEQSIKILMSELSI